MLDKYKVIDSLESTINALRLIPASKYASDQLRAFLECVENGEFDFISSRYSKEHKYA